MRVMYRLINVSNSAALGVEWWSDGTRCQLTSVRGGDGLTFAAQTHAGDEWLVSPVENPDRFGGPVTDMRRLRVVARRFIQEATGE